MRPSTRHGLFDQTGSVTSSADSTEGDGERMKILHELNWLWEMLGIALAAAAVCVTFAALICKATKRRPNKKMLAVVGAAAFAGAILAVILIARTPMPL